jgi:hypothetical protein
MDDSLARGHATPTLSAQSRDSRSPSPTPLSSPDTTITEPEQSPGDDGDIWDTSSDHDHLPTYNHQTSASLPHYQDGDSHPRFLRNDILSDLPALRRQHMTDGYREGLSVGKARVMQDGFDAGYPVGMEVGLRVGTVLGVLEGVIAALTSSRSKGRFGKGKGFASGSRIAAEPEIELGVDVASDDTGSQAGGTRNQEEDLKDVQAMYARAKEELKISELLKGLDDEMIASIPDATPLDGGDVEHHGMKEAKGTVSLLKCFEDVLVRWESLVLGALRQNSSD